ncbi:penicillin-binding protein activator [Methylovirgula sp. 4M-Z18]|uniref:penicillin-binding protein activator n=1 Tax=Methylovirgula sp. 4M-Z18 TaxID=2293567 RepID=UPI001FDF3AB9|nr:penicillin-binding protein activator [Methylovirgula sp. 4M-Z18]
MTILTRKEFLRLGGLALVTTSLSACGQLGVPFGESEPPAPATPAQNAPSGGNIGNGPIHVALILPLTSQSGASQIGVSMRNAAELALSDSGSSELTILVKDDRSSPDGARQAAQEALNDGAQLFIGPLFAANVREVSSVAHGAGKSVIAFSTDPTVAAPGTYLLSFPIDGKVNRVLDFAASRGKKSFAVLAPDAGASPASLAAFAAFQSHAGDIGVRVQSVERYPAGKPGDAVKRVATVAQQIDGIFIADDANGMGAMATALTANGLDGRKIQLLGTDAWEDPRTMALPALQGAWFAAPDDAGFRNFAQRYRAKYNSEPHRLASLAYDATSLAAALPRVQSANPYTDAVLTDSKGFTNVDGFFRFRTNGQVERALAVYQIGNGSKSILDAAPRSLPVT